MEYWRKIFRERFTELKASEGLTQAKVAEACNVTQGTVGHWYRGERRPGGLSMFRDLELAIRIAPGALTQPDPPDGQTYYQVEENSQNYKPSIDIDIVELATSFLMDEIGLVGMEKMGARWVAETIIMLYDLFSDPASEQLSRSTIVKMVGNIRQ